MKRTPVVVLLGAVLMVAIVFGVWMSRRPSGAGGPDTTNLVPRAPTNLVLRVPNTKFMGLLPLYVAEDKGFFRREGVDLKWVDVKDPQQAANLLFDGQADFLMTTFAGVLPAESRQAGTLKFLCAVGEVGSRPGSFILVASNSPVQSVRDLRGKVVGTYSGGSQKAYALIVLERLGLGAAICSSSSLASA
jgi:NitT/TauT family transport system substrate-binding protein